MRTIHVVYQASFVVTTCLYCHKHEAWRSVDRRTGHPRPTAIFTARRWALEAGWTTTPRKQYVCPTCSKTLADGGKVKLA